MSLIVWKRTIKKKYIIRKSKSSGRGNIHTCTCIAQSLQNCVCIENITITSRKNVPIFPLSVCRRVHLLMKKSLQQRCCISYKRDLIYIYHQKYNQILANHQRVIHNFYGKQRVWKVILYYSKFQVYVAISMIRVCNKTIKKNLR